MRPDNVMLMYLGALNLMAFSELFHLIRISQKWAAMSHIFFFANISKTITFLGKNVEQKLCIAHEIFIEKKNFCSFVISTYILWSMFPFIT